MFNNLKSINIKGGFFDEEKQINLFESEKDRISFIYGRNGSGKTSISNAFINIRNDANTNYDVIKLNDFNENEITLTNEEKRKLYIFNESFIDNKIKFCEDGMNTIVMFGQQIELEDKLKEYNDELLILREDYKKEKDLQTKYENEKNTISPKYHINVINDFLKGDTSWAAREQKIKNLSRKSSVNDSIINSIISIPYKKDIKGEMDELDNNITFLSKIKTDAKKFPEISFNNMLISNYEKELNTKLMQKLEKPELTERENLIFEIIENGMQSNINSAKNYFEQDVSFCPYCFQEINNEYKNDLLNSFKKVLNEKVENYIKDLETYHLNLVNFDITPYMPLNAELCSSIVNILKELNEQIEFVNATIDDKIKNVYVDTNIPKISIQKLYVELDDNINKLSAEVKSYNQKIDNVNKTIENSQKLNKIIARNEIDSYLTAYNKSIKEKNENNIRLNNLTNKGKLLNQKIAEINNKKKNIDIALKKINDDLEYIFFGKNRLSLICENDKYMVLSYGQKVELNKLSVGERNAIALCYYFTQILENTEETNNYTNDFLLIIDDPISSFDFENKIGMFSFLRLKLNKILNNNSSNKVIIFTHSIEAMINFQKYKEEFKNYGMSYLSLFNKETKKFQKFDKNSYTQAFNLMYQYANNPTEENDLIIGNSMRKVLEAFSTFQSKNSIELFMRDSDILELIPTNLRDYFENFMYRLVLNGESHLSEQSMSYPDSNFYEFISQDEKQTTAKNLLSFIYIINPIHVKKQLGNNTDYINNVESWVNELKEAHK